MLFSNIELNKENSLDKNLFVTFGRFYESRIKKNLLNLCHKDGFFVSFF